MKIKINNLSNHPLPKYQTEYSAGMDLYANIGDDIYLKPMQRMLISTGISLEIPDGCEGQIRPRSGLAYKHGISVVNSPGTIDADYRGELKVLLINLGDANFKISSGDRIAQLIVAKFEKVSWIPTEQLDETVRGKGGYGHTGIKK